MKNAQYIIGIDLGTTNSTVACTKNDLNSVTGRVIDQVPLIQALTVEEEGKLLHLPSFIYFPLKEEGLSMNKPPHVVGAFAKNRGAEIPARLISSSKSWLCHASVDRRENILPLNSDVIDSKMSPLTACVEILRQIKKGWNQEKPEADFNQQQIYITVPASFDPSARQLVQEAAELASYPEVVLLEEPQAAFYSWLHRNEQDWRRILGVGDSVLVVDIGGGTTDFSLIVAEEEDGDLSLQRQAVGSHLLLGGDNIDLALAYYAKEKIEELGHTIDDWQMQSLVYQCRQAKENFLSESPSSSFTLTILGRGTRLIGQTITIDIERSTVLNFILDGFFPSISYNEQPVNEKKSGIQQIGLPYASDPRISAQLAKFLCQALNADTKSPHIPSAVLFNGGTLKSTLLRQQILSLLNDWASGLNKPAVKELQKADYDFAVSQGAVTYGLAREGHAIRIKGGVSRAYFIGVEEAAPAVPGINPPLTAICIVPLGMEEGEEVELDSNAFILALGQVATFRFFSFENDTLPTGEKITVGTCIKRWKNLLTELHPIEANLKRESGQGDTAKIRIRSKVTELGVLEVWCVSDEGQKWKLEFDIRAR